MSQDYLEDGDTFPPVSASFTLTAAKVLKAIGLTLLILGLIAAAIGTLGLAVPAIAAATAGVIGLAGAGVLASGAVLTGGVVAASAGVHIWSAGRIKELKQEPVNDIITTPNL